MNLSIRNLGLKLGAAFLAAIFTGIISGILLRVLMKIVALVFPLMARGFTMEGMLTLLMTGVMFCLANSILYTFIENTLPTSWFMKGALYGSFNLITYGIPFFLSNPDNDLFGAQAVLGVMLFSMLFITAGVLLAFSMEQIRNWIYAKQVKRQKTTFY